MKKKNKVISVFGQESDSIPEPAQLTVMTPVYVIFALTISLFIGE